MKKAWLQAMRQMRKRSNIGTRRLAAGFLLPGAAALVLAAGFDLGPGVAEARSVQDVQSAASGKEIEKERAGAERASAAVEAAVEAARSTPLPDYKALQATGDIKDVIDSSTGSTSAIESLRQNGQGVLFAPGRTEADRCWSASDPTCLAVQVVDKASVERPEIDPDLAGDLIAGRDEVAGSADDIIDVDGTGSTGSCRPHTSTITKPSTTQTCDVRTWTEGTSSTHACMTAWESIMEESSAWACRIVEREEFSATCSVPVVVRQETTSRVACYEGVKEAQKNTCPVIVTAEEKQKHLAVCVTPLYRTVQRQCSRRLVVKPTGTCTIGAVTEVSNTDYAALTEDAVPGADTLTVSTTCSETPDGVLPSITISTNRTTHGPAEVSVATNEAVFDLPVTLAGGSARFSGSTSCNGRECISSVRMTVFAGTGASAVYSGEVFARLVFVRFMKIDEAEYWSETCTGI